MTEAAASARPSGPSAWRWLPGVLAVLFGLATLFEGGHVLFGGPEARAEAGKVVPFVLVFNFSAAFGYVITGAATLARQRWAVWAARALAAATVLVLCAFGVHVLQGGEYERRTAIAMTVRSMFWVAQALVLPLLLPRPAERGGHG